MIAQWPPKPRYASAKRLREAVNARAQTNALADIDSLRSGKPADVSNKHLTNMRDDLAAIIDESDRP